MRLDAEPRTGRGSPTGGRPEQSAARGDGGPSHDLRMRRPKVSQRSASRVHGFLFFCDVGSGGAVGVLREVRPAVAVVVKTIRARRLSFCAVGRGGAAGILPIVG
jgi:hypothetical protein